MELLNSVINTFWEHGSHTGTFCPGKNHVANGYKEAVYVFVDCDRAITTNKMAEMEAESNKLKYQETREIVHIANSKGYSAVAPNTVELFRPGHNDTKYISIFSRSGTNLCGCKPIGCNDSVMVDSEGYVSLTKMGTVWERRT